MKKTSLFLVALMLAFPIAFASSSVKTDTEFTEPSAERVSFKIKDTGSKNIAVTIGIGSQPGSGACCSGVSPFTTASFVGNVGEVVYDGKTRRVITKISRDMDGTTLDLAQYYWFPLYIILVTFIPNQKRPERVFFVWGSLIFGIQHQPNNAGILWFLKPENFHINSGFCFEFFSFLGPFVIFL